MNIFNNLSMFVLVVTVGLVSGLQTAQASDEVVSAYECTQVSLDDIDESLLTKEEKLALMEQGLKRSIDSYATCVGKVQQQQASGGAGGGLEGEGDGNESASEGNQVANSNSNNGDAPPQEVNTPTTEQSQTTPAQRKVGKPKDNDSIICQLLWEEIQTAPEDKLAGFKKQYAEYKCG
ncbi:hypothetical protein [Glaciecola sp. 1036]|uniref:hypothetical protein n=1 Tax=Alteromonadaceae TaxID=72275 RepID=UPI003D079682